MNEQGTAEWFSARTGKLTASRMKDAMNFKRDGTPSEARQKYMFEMIAERMSDQVVHHYVSPEMQWGKDQELPARAEYELRTGRKVKPCFFFDHFDIEYFGASPDGLVDDGLIETKCPKTATHIAWIVKGVVPEEHKPQMLAQMACTGRKWCDFVSFDPRIRSESRLFVVRFAPDQSEIDAVEEAARTFLAEAEYLFDQLHKEAA